MKRLLWIFAVLLFACTVKLQAQTASFNFSKAPQSVSGWVNVYGDPAIAAVTGTSSGITVSSVATTNWANLGGSCAFDGGGAAGGTFFPAAVMANHWYQYSSYYGLYNSLVPQLLLSGLNKDSVYTIKMTGSFTGGGYNLNPIRYTVTGAIIYGYDDVNGTNNTSDGAVFHNIAPDASGTVKVYVNTYGGSDVASICGIQIIPGHTSAPTPVVSISHPSNNSIIPEDGTITISANASETGGTIRKVEFYLDTTKIGEDSIAPYNLTWAASDPGTYQIKARAIDGFGNTSVATINVTVESLNYFWSTTGNIATGGDTSFVGTVDTNRLAFRTNNVERMSISKDGNVTVGGKDTASHPAFRVYGNGDLVAGTTMDRSVSTDAQVGMRYYSKLGIMQVGASDRLDTTQNPIVYGTWPSSGVIINTDVANTIKGKMMNTVFAGDANTMDSLTHFENVIIASENSHFAAGMNQMFNVIVSGYGMNISAPVTDALISGNANQITKPVLYSNINGFANSTADYTSGSLINGAYNQFGGFSQLVSGNFLVNRTPLGTTLGNSNVDFATLPYTGSQQVNAPNIDQYPLLALGNGANASGTVRSNALTVLFNGRTQINTTGFTNQLTQANVTPAAALDVVSTNTGVLLPRLTNAQRNAIVAGDLKNGLLLYNTDSSVFQYYNGSAWNSVGSGGGSGSSGRWLFNGTANTVYDSADNIAIGTNDAKGYKLAVKGTGLFTRVQVLSLSNWPDYVFKKEYRLRKLEDLASYIDRYHHLPDVVSAATVGKVGLDLGANQAAILKKVEELTLYLIDENKRLSSQNSQLEGQSKKIAALETQLAEQGRQRAEQTRQIAEQNALFQQQQRQIDELKALIKKK